MITSPGMGALPISTATSASGVPVGVNAALGGRPARRPVAPNFGQGHGQGIVNAAGMSPSFGPFQQKIKSESPLHRLQ
jgi:hypothetical protein